MNFDRNVNNFALNWVCILSHSFSNVYNGKKEYLNRNSGTNGLTKVNKENTSLMQFS